MRQSGAGRSGEHGAHNGSERDFKRGGSTRKSAWTTAGFLPLLDRFWYPAAFIPRATPR